MMNRQRLGVSGTGRLTASARELALGFFLGSRFSLGLPDLNVGRRLQQGLDLVDALLRRVLRLLLLFAMRAVSARHLVCLRVQQVMSGFFTPAALAMHASLTEEPKPEVRAGAPKACLSAARNGFRP